MHHSVSGYSGPGEHILLLDDTGCAHEAVLTVVTPERALARVVSRTQPATEPRLHLTLCQALVTEQKLDWILQKGTDAIPKTERDAIYRDWISIRYQHRVDYTWLWGGVGAAMLILLLVFAERTLR